MPSSSQHKQTTKVCKVIGIISGTEIIAEAQSSAANSAISVKFLRFGFFINIPRLKILTYKKENCNLLRQ